ncbi:MAG TPA: hypothetical protein VIU15_11895 [Streptomyces sp.]
MTETQEAVAVLSASAAAARLRALGAGGRGFLGRDPVTENDSLLARELGRDDTVVLAVGDTLLGARISRLNPRRAEISASAADPKALRALAEFLATYRRCFALTAVVAEGDPSWPALEELGFTRTAVLRDHWYRTGRYVDGHVLHLATRRPAAGPSTLEPSCA